MNHTQERTVIFLHIPKAAGTTLSSIIAKQYEPQCIFTINGSRVRESIEQFKQLPETQRKAIQVLQGHMYFGLHEFLPGPSTYITLLRHPVDRIISHYYFVLRVPNHYLHDQVVQHRMTLRDYVSSGISAELDNDQTRMLSGVGGLNGFRKCSVEMLEVAKQNVSKYFTVAGLVEKFDETLMLLKYSLGWENVFYVRENRNGKPNVKKYIAKEDLKAIEKHNELDIDLYNYVEGNFKGRFDQRTFSFEKELKTFRAMNRVYSLSYPVRSIFRSL